MTRSDPGGVVVGGRYRLVERIASGGTADVWRAIDERLGRTVALKRLHPHLVRDERFRERLAREARAVAALDHPSIVRVHDVVVDGEGAAIALEFVDGESLAERLAREGPLTPTEAARITIAVASGLAAAHRDGILHRDLTPANVVLPWAGGARLIDFGIARLLDDERERLTADGEAIGTWRWMAPEQRRGAPPTTAVDVYGLGGLLGFMLTGRAPSELRESGGRGDETGASNAGRSGLLAIALQCLEEAPEDRPPSIAEVEAYLRGWLAREDDLGRAGLGATAPDRSPALPAARPTAVSSARTVAARPQTPTFRGGRRRYRPTITAIAPLVAFLAVAAAAIIALGPLLAHGPGVGGQPSPSPVTTPVTTPVPTPTPTPVPTPTPPPTPPAAGARIVLLRPTDGTVVDTPEVVIEGLAPPGALVIREVNIFQDQQTTAGADGSWIMRVALDAGDNALTFRVGDDPTTARTIHVTWSG